MTGERVRVAPELLLPEWPAPDNVRAVFTTRRGGRGRDPFKSFNVAMHVGDDPADVALHRHALEQELALERSPCWLNQVHGARSVTAETSVGQAADASFSRIPRMPCTVMVADCLPVLLCDRDGSQVAAAHAGWKGLAAGVIESIVGEFPGPDNLLAWLGPAIGPCHYEVGGDVRETFGGDSDCFTPGRTSGRWMMDLCALARSRLHDAGVTRVYGGQMCTYCDRERFFSYRRDGITGRNAALIWMV